MANGNNLEIVETTEAGTTTLDHYIDSVGYALLETDLYTPDVWVSLKIEAWDDERPTLGIAFYSKRKTFNYWQEVNFPVEVSTGFNLW